MATTERAITLFKIPKAANLFAKLTDWTVLVLSHWGLRDVRNDIYTWNLRYRPLPSIVSSTLFRCEELTVLILMAQMWMRLLICKYFCFDGFCVY